MSQSLISRWCASRKDFAKPYADSVGRSIKMLLMNALQKDADSLLTRPPRWLMHLATLGIFIWTLDAFSAPGFYTLAALVAILLWFLLIAAWLLRLIMALLTKKSLRRWQWAVVPIAALLTLAMLWSEAPMRLRFAISKPDLARLAQQAIAAGPKPLSPWETTTIQRAGAYDVIVAQVSRNGEVDIAVSGTFFMRSCSGFTYDPAGSPFDPEGSFEPLGGSWYVWHTSW
jgi:hypothetical protein